MEPWNLVKQEGLAGAQTKLHQTIFYASEALRIAAIHLQPIMPSKMDRLLNELGVRPERRSLGYASLAADTEYGIEPEELAKLPRVQKWNALFPQTVDAHITDLEWKEKEEASKSQSQDSG